MTTVITSGLARWKEHRERRDRYEAEQLAAYQEILSVAAEVRALTLRTFLDRVGHESKSEWLKIVNPLVGDAVRRLGSARSRLLLAEHSPEVAARVDELWRKALAALYSGPMMPSPEDEAKFTQWFRAHEGYLGALAKEIEAVEAFCVRRAALLREVQSSVLPHGMAMRLAQTHHPELAAKDKPEDEPPVEKDKGVK